MGQQGARTISSFTGSEGGGFGREPPAKHLLAQAWWTATAHNKWASGSGRIRGLRPNRPDAQTDSVNRSDRTKKEGVKNEEDWGRFGGPERYPEAKLGQEKPKNR